MHSVFPFESGLTLRDVASQEELDLAVSEIRLRRSDDLRIATVAEANVITDLRLTAVSPDEQRILFAVRHRWCYIPGYYPCFGAYKLVVRSIEGNEEPVLATIPLHEVNLYSKRCRSPQTTLLREFRIKELTWSSNGEYAVAAIVGTDPGCSNLDRVNANLVFISLSDGKIKTFGEGAAWSFDFALQVMTVLDRQCDVHVACTETVRRIAYSDAGEVFSQEVYPIDPALNPFTINGVATSNRSIVFNALPRGTDTGFGVAVLNATTTPSVSNLLKFGTESFPIRLVSMHNGVNILIQTANGVLWKAEVLADNTLQYTKFYAGPVESFELGADGTLLVREAGTRYAIISADGVKLHEVDLLQALSKSSSALATLSEDMIVAVSW